MSEILAIKLLKNYTTRDLIDALCYEFYPLQGQMPLIHPRAAGGRQAKQSPIARISCLEVAIRAQAKRFLSHPVVVRQLKAIWSGTIVFHSVADNLHRQPAKAKARSKSAAPHISRSIPSHGHNRSESSEQGVTSPRRSVTLYDPRDASLFKLSRLRVPLYRHLLSTLSFAVLLALFLSVLKERRVEITLLEVVFWFWSAGFMLDEIVGFNEQGFSLYLMSFWNLFDLGILLLLFIYYCLRIYGVVIPFSRSEVLASQAYDVLAANAVLIFPRLFSTLDHYRYFSQLLIAFRIMASDLIAVIFLVIIACSGFLVAFISFSKNYYSPASVAFNLFQMLMGFTPAAWALWDEYNALGKTILTVFLFICHFVVVTILITVLTNSFMAIVHNAYEEHQFLFAVNTISMVKSDALFAYVAPTNIMAWAIIPLRYLMPFSQFVKLNRTIIKITHFPILFTICLYEKVILGPRIIQPADLIEGQPRSGVVNGPAQHPGGGRFHAFKRDASRMVREPSVTTYQKDRALEEVFRRPFFKDDSVQGPAGDAARQQSSNIVRSWIRGMSPASGHPPSEQNTVDADRLEKKPSRLRSELRRTRSGGLPAFTEEARSVPTNPDDFTLDPKLASRGRKSFMPGTRTRSSPSPQAVSEGDDELTSEENEEGKQSIDSLSSSSQNGPKAVPKFYSSRPSTARPLSRRTSPVRRLKGHSRNASTTTMLYAPARSESDSDGAESSSRRMEIAGTRASRPNSISMADIEGSSTAHLPGRERQLPFELGSDLGDNRAAVTSGFVGAAPSSFTTHMAAYATRGNHRRRQHSDFANNDMLSKLVLARMNNIEELLTDHIKEVKGLRREEYSRNQSGTQSTKRRGDNRDSKKDVVE